MPITQKTYAVQGKSFKLLPTTPKNRKALAAMMAERDRMAAEYSAAMQEILDTAEELGEGLSGDELAAQIDNLGESPDGWDLYADVFRVLTEGPHDEIDWEEFDLKIGEVVLDDFLPHAAKMTMRQAGFLGQSAP